LAGPGVGVSILQDHQMYPSRFSMAIDEIVAGIKDRTSQVPRIVARRIFVNMVLDQRNYLNHGRVFSLFFNIVLTRGCTVRKEGIGVRIVEKKESRDIVARGKP